MKIDIGFWPRPRGETHLFADFRSCKVEERIEDMLATMEAHAAFVSERRDAEALWHATQERQRLERLETQREEAREQSRQSRLAGQLEPTIIAAEISEMEAFSRRPAGPGAGPEPA